MFIALLKASVKATEVRSEQRAAHDAYWETRMEQIWLAGPLLDGEQRKGQIMIVKATSREEAQVLIENDPYVLNGAFEPFEVSAFRASVREGRMA